MVLELDSFVGELFGNVGVSPLLEFFDVFVDNCGWLFGGYSVGLVVDNCVVEGE